MKVFFKICIGLLPVFLLLSSCSKYEDGPLLSVNSKSARVEGFYRIKTIDTEKNDFPQPAFLDDLSIEFQKNGGGHLSMISYDTLIQSNFEWEFNDDMTDIRVRRFYLHKDTAMYLALDSVFYFCFNTYLHEYDNLQQAMYGNHEKWGEWGSYMRISELSNEIFSYKFESDSTDLSIKIVLSE